MQPDTNAIPTVDLDTWRTAAVVSAPFIRERLDAISVG